MKQTRNLKGLNSSTFYQFWRGEQDVSIGAYVVTTPVFAEISEGWERDEVHQWITDVLYEAPAGQLRLTREIQKWNSSDGFVKPVTLEIIDRLIDASCYDSITVVMVGSIPGELYLDVKPRIKYEVLYKDVECRLISKMSVIDDPSQDRGVDIPTDLILEVVAYPQWPNVVSTKLLPPNEE